MTAATRSGRPRDERLDLFRGLAMLIIVIAHIPENAWNDWIPARFGFSSAAEMFVLCSGIACAKAYGRAFDEGGLIGGAARTAKRIWTLYWAQIAPFLIVFAVSSHAAAKLGAPQSMERLDLGWFMTHPAEGVRGLLTLSYIPHYFDMLPLYVVLLALMPLVEAARRVDRRLPLAAALTLWACVHVTGLNLPARPDTDARWYFNPFAWQLLFFIGYAFGRGDLRPPAFGVRRLVAPAAAFVLVAIPVSFWWFVQTWPALETIPMALRYDGAPTTLHPLRLLHILAAAYLALTLIDPVRHRLTEVWIGRLLISVGRKTLPAFLVSVPLALSLGVALDVLGRDALTVTAANLIGLLGVIATTRLIAWLDAEPWRSRAPAVASAPQAAAARAVGARPSISSSD